MEKMHFLLVEDDPSAAMIARIALEEGWASRNIEAEVTICSNGHDALAYLETASRLPDIIITDIKMPKLDGNQLLGILKAKLPYRLIPVVVLTTSDDPKDIERAYLGQCSGYILKSPDFSDFQQSLELIQKYWELSRLPETIAGQEGE